MPKKKGAWKCTNSDFTLNDSANAPKPVRRLKKAAVSEKTTTADLNWDKMEDGPSRQVYKKKNILKVDDIGNSPGIEYPEIVFYLISAHIKPEQVGSFAGINKAAYACTQRESFWCNLYKRYCQNHPRLPQRLRIENSFKAYGLRQRVIRALYHTYSVFVHKVELDAIQDSKPRRLVKQCCVNVWHDNGPKHCTVYFKFKKVLLQRPQGYNSNMIEELGNIHANPEVDCQVLQVTCADFYEVPTLLGKFLTALSVIHSPGFQQLSLGFHSSAHSLSRNLVPERWLIFGNALTIRVFDWWHPKYPHFDNIVPPHMKDEESLPVLKKDFFNMSLGE